VLGVKRYEVQLTPYDKEWATLFLDTKYEVQQILGSNVIDIQHIGSTSIKSIVAKPILDVAVIVYDLDKINFEGMKNNGYVFGGEAGVTGRSFFAKYRDGDISTHHIHCYEKDNQNLLANIAFRDYLIAHPDYAKQYSDLKMQLAKRYKSDRVTYTNEKTEFIKIVLQLAKEETDGSMGCL
jgi:Uncharacterized conserved protein